MEEWGILGNSKGNRNAVKNHCQNYPDCNAAKFALHRGNVALELPLVQTRLTSNEENMEQEQGEQVHGTPPTDFGVPPVLFRGKSRISCLFWSFLALPCFEQLYNSNIHTTHTSIR